MDLLEDIEECHPVRKDGIGGMQIAVNKTGYLRDLDIRMKADGFTDTNNG